MESLATISKEFRRIVEHGSYRILAELQYEHCVDFKILQVACWDERDVPEFPTKRDADIFTDTTTNVNQAWAFMTAFCKGDGCFQIYFHDEPALHFDFEDNVKSFSQIIPRMYEIAKDMMGEGWYGDR